MTFEEFKRCIMEMHSEEDEDMSKYQELSRYASNNGMHRISGILHDISLDEESHANMLAHIINMEAMNDGNNAIGDRDNHSRDTN